MTKRTYGHTKSGTPITDDRIEELADEAEAGYDVDQIIAGRGSRDAPDSGPLSSTPTWRRRSSFGNHQAP